MGTLEERGRRKTRRRNVSLYVLSAVQLAGLLGVMLVAPNTLTGMKKLGLVPGPRQKESINRARNRLVQKGLLKREGGFLRLTPQGEKALRIMMIREHGIPTPARWDGKWRVLIFDVPEYRKKIRESIRHSLCMIGFVRLQDSVWVYPYDCEDFVALLKADLKIGKDVLYLIVEEMEGDAHLKQIFNLH